MQLRQTEVSFVMCVSVWCVDRDLGVGGGGGEGGLGGLGLRGRERRSRVAPVTKN